jgi:hypothetical protein
MSAIGCAVRVATSCQDVRVASFRERLNGTRTALSDRDARRSLILRARRPSNLLQPFNDTSDDRYPDIFRFVAKSMEGADAPVILSFGCSKGNEVFSIRRYVPRAEVIGLDISAGNIRDCLKRLEESPDPKVTFRRGSDVSGFADASLDAILCLAVLRHGDLSRPGTQSCSHRLPFKTFERTVIDFDRCLRMGGLLAIEHSNLRFCDAAVADRYRCVLRLERAPDPRTPLFDTFDRLIKGASYPEVVFRKVR